MSDSYNKYTYNHVYRHYLEISSPLPLVQRPQGLNDKIDAIMR